MLNRRNFLKTGLMTGAAVIPMSVGLDALDPISTLSAEENVGPPSSVSKPKLIPLPPRLASIDQATQSWQQKIRRVGQSNMTEHDPAVMNIEEWADYWHSAECRHRLHQRDRHPRLLSLEGAVPSPWKISAMAATSSASAWPPRRSATCAWSRA